MCIPEAALHRGRRAGRNERGVSLVELVVFIIIVSVGIAGVMVALNTGTRNAVDPMVRKQALAIAEGLLEEVELMSYTYCDPDDPNAPVATGSADCTGGTNGPNDEAKLPLGPEAGESRYSVATPFDNVSDYNGFDTATADPIGIADLTGTVIPALAGYQAQVAVALQPIAGVNEMLRITVTVTHAVSNTTVVLEGYRAQYWPTTTP
jgi:MSHA pilin protein MshD